VLQKLLNTILTAAFVALLPIAAFVALLPIAALLPPRLMATLQEQLLPDQSSHLLLPQQSSLVVQQSQKIGRPGPQLLHRRPHLSILLGHKIPQIFIALQFRLHGSELIDEATCPVLDQVYSEHDEIEAFFKALPFELDVAQFTAHEFNHLREAVPLEREGGQLAHLPHGHHLVPVTHNFLHQLLGLTLFAEHLLGEGLHFGRRLLDQPHIDYNCTAREDY